TEDERAEDGARGESQAVGTGLEHFQEIHAEAQEHHADLQEPAHVSAALFAPGIAHRKGKEEAKRQGRAALAPWRSAERRTSAIGDGRFIAIQARAHLGSAFFCSSGSSLAQTLSSTWGSAFAMGCMPSACRSSRCSATPSSRKGSRASLYCFARSA